MPVIEYKLIKTKEGNEVPPYVKNGGHWRNPADFTMLGWVDPEPRKYWVPDTILELDLDGVIQRGIDMHSADPFVNIVNDPSHEYTELDNMDSYSVMAMMNEWYENFVEQNS